MGQGDAEVATPLSYPGWTREGGPGQGLASDSGEDGYGNGSSNGEDDEQRSDFNNKSFLEDATSSSCSGTLPQRFRHRHRHHHHHHHRQQYSESDIGNHTRVLQVYAYANATANMEAQSCAHQLPRRPSTAFVSSTGEPKNYLAGESFLLSRQTSAATMAMTTTSSEGAAVPATSTAHPLPLLSFESAWCQEPKVDLRLPRESEHHTDRHQGLFDAFNYDHLRPDGRSFAHHDRPSSSRSHVPHWRRSRNIITDDWRDSIDDSAQFSSLDCNQPSMVITKEEYDSLPPTIQRKYFSIIERSLLARQDIDDHLRLGSAGHNETYLQEPVLEKPSKHRRQHKSKATPEPLSEPTQRSRINSAEQRFFENLPEKIKRQHLTEEEQIAARYRRQTLLHGPPKEQLLTVTKRQQRDLNMMQSPLGSPALSEGHSSLSSMPHPHEDHLPLGHEKKGSESFCDSFRWLEEEDSLDLRLYLDDYHINLREEIPVPKTRRPSFRRHLSINKLPFGRGSISYSRPPVKETPRSPSAASSYKSYGPGTEGRPRRRSRALSLMSPTVQTAPAPEPVFDPCAPHYQDPEARMKVRAFLASPQKFDEALQFGFPSADGAETAETRLVKGRVDMESSSKFRSFLEDDQSSTSSEEASIEDPETPKTPQLFAAPERPPKTITERSHHVGIGSSRNPLASREMTLRMTLTRPDLRANEEQMYGWKRASRQQDTAAPGPVIYARGENRKESIERQLAALDEWSDDVRVEDGVVKRIWNRVRRS